MITVIDTIHAWQVEENDSIEAFGDTLIVVSIDDRGDGFLFECTDEDGEQREIEVLADVLFPLLGYVEEDE